MTERDMDWEDKYFQALIISLVIHGLILAILRWGPPPRPIVSSLAPVEVVYTSEPVAEPRNARQIVQDPEVGEVIKELQKEARYLSRLNRRVQEEMSATRTDVSRPRRQRGDNGDGRELNLNPQPMDEERVFGMSVPSHELGRGLLGKDLVTGESATMDFLPNVKQGGFTALNTNQFSFYSFFSRINEQLYGRWRQNLRVYIPQIPMSALRSVSNQDLVTRIEVVFDRNGYYQSHMVLKSSGQRPVDQAVVAAFLQAAPFLNPPQGLIEPDGRIRLNYEFRLILNPSFLATQ